MQMADVVPGRVSTVARELLGKGQGEKTVSRVEVSCLFAVTEAELVLKLEEVVVPVAPIRKLRLNPGSAEGA